MVDGFNPLHKLALSEREVSQLYGISVLTLRSWRRNKSGPKYHKINGKLVKYRKEDVDRFIFSNPIPTKDSTD